MQETDHFYWWMQRFPRSSSGEEREFYEEACDNVPEWLATNHDDIHRFRDELAAHIRDSSHGPYTSETQWSTDEILRDFWFDVFGIEPPPGDPYPVPPERWGRHRMTDYMQQIPHNPDRVNQATNDWLVARGVTLDDLAAYYEPGTETDFLRPEPPGYRERLAELTNAGLRTGPAENEHAKSARTDLHDAKQMYRDIDRDDLADNIDTVLDNYQPRDDT